MPIPRRRELTSTPCKASRRAQRQRERHGACVHSDEFFAHRLCNGDAGVDVIGVQRRAAQEHPVTGRCQGCKRRQLRPPDLAAGISHAAYLIDDRLVAAYASLVPNRLLAGCTATRRSPDEPSAAGFSRQRPFPVRPDRFQAITFDESSEASLKRRFSVASPSFLLDLYWTIPI